MVGDGKTSVRRAGGSFLSLVQMPVPQANVLGVWPRPRTEEPRPEDVVPQVAAPASTAGVLGWDVVGDMELLANEPFLG